MSGLCQRQSCPPGPVQSLQLTCGHVAGMSWATAAAAEGCGDLPSVVSLLQVEVLAL